MDSEILLVTLNARYHHTAFGLRYLYSNLHDLRDRARISEFTIAQTPEDIAEKILALNPRLVGFGVYIWNTAQTGEVISILKRIRPDLLIVLGGPEVSHESGSQAICQLADYTFKGEAELLFYEFCRAYLANGTKPPQRLISGDLPELKKLAFPYTWYTDEDIRNRVVYVEASRGCPYKCEYCLSSLDKSVRSFEVEKFLLEMERLIERGARQFKFVDRTFNLSVTTSTRILRFFLDRISLGLFIHFEMVPDRLPEELRELIVQFPPGAMQFEIGIQTWNPEIARRISRRQDYVKIRENFRFLRQKTGVHTHADLIVGLPGETLESFAAGFDAVAELEPDEIQVGILKRLKGAPIIRHDQEWEMAYSEHPPFQVLRTSAMDFETIRKMARFSKYWDLVANSGNFSNAMSLFRSVAREREQGSLFALFWELAIFLSERHPHAHGIALLQLVESVWVFLSEECGIDKKLVRETLLKDYTGKVRRDVPRFLREGNGSPRAAGNSSGEETRTRLTHLPDRQRRHLAGASPTRQ